MITFYLLAFTISWAGWVPVLLGSYGVAVFQSPLWKACYVLPAIGPAVAVGITVRLRRESGSLPQRLRALFRWRISPRWYLIAVLMPLGLLLIAAGLSRVWPTPSAATSLPLSASGLVTFSFLSLLANPCEEVGWRGFALTRLQARYHPIVATLIVRVLWSAWHVPIFLLPAGTISMSSVPFAPWFVATMAVSFVVTWLFNSASSSVLIASLFHVAMNVVGAVIGVSSYPALAVVEVLAAIGLCVLYGPRLASEQAAART